MREPARIAGSPPATAGRPSPCVSIGWLAAVVLMTLALLATGAYLGASYVPKCPGGYVPTWLGPWHMACTEVSPGSR